MENLSYRDVKNVTNVISHFEVAKGTVSKVSVFTGGRINKTYKVTIKNLNDEKIYLLQKVNGNVFADVDGLMENVVKVTSYIKDKQKETINFIRVKKCYLSENQKCYLNESLYSYYKWRCYEFIEADVYDCINKPDDMEKLGIAVAEFCKDLNEFDAHQLIETIPDFHNTRKRFETLLIKLIRSKDEERKKLAEKSIDSIIGNRELFSTIIERLDKGIIPLRVTHNDPKLNNVLFDKETSMPKCMIDLDTVMPGSILYDIGDAIRYGANTASEEESDPNKVEFDLELYEKFIKGYLWIMGDYITDEEYEIMHLAPQVLTWELAIRFLTDYLDEDKYFGASYPTQNLDRAKIQLALAYKMYNKTKEMKDIVEKYRYAKK